LPSFSANWAADDSPLAATLLTVLPEELELDAPEVLAERPLLLLVLLVLLVLLLPPATEVAAELPESVLVPPADPLPQAYRLRHAAAAAAISSGEKRGCIMGGPHGLFDYDCN
jgi:hypothetical protein